MEGRVLLIFLVEAGMAETVHFFAKTMYTVPNIIGKSAVWMAQWAYHAAHSDSKQARTEASWRCQSTQTALAQDRPHTYKGHSFHYPLMTSHSRYSNIEVTLRRSSSSSPHSPVLNTSECPPLLQAASLPMVYHRNTPTILWNGTFSIHLDLVAKWLKLDRFLTQVFQILGPCNAKYVTTFAMKHPCCMFVEWSLNAQVPVYID